MVASDLNEARVAFLVTPGFDYVAVQWGIWRAGGIAVPLPMSHPPAELEYLIRDSEASIVIADARMRRSSNRSRNGLARAFSDLPEQPIEPTTHPDSPNDSRSDSTGPHDS